jgi:hypothetical protein
MEGKKVFFGKHINPKWQSESCSNVWRTRPPPTHQPLSSPRFEIREIPQSSKVELYFSSGESEREREAATEDEVY